ncbi:hypothetical protein [Sediminibacter sp. Hel_I_10]|uniref:hypothetical protein n=1 Tax=Sediminibacter sp. Hel_I_10 TaxID=1392490 RepID=UPI00047CA0BA|nr:hypothetical protein [Sediminibacter sp. Hel_I_10]
MQHTASYNEFANESAMLHFLLIYFEMASPPHTESLKQSMLTQGSATEWKDHFIYRFLDESDSEELFKSDTYKIILNQMVYSRLSDNFLNYLKSILAEIIVKQPKILSSKETVSIENVLKHSTLDDFLSDFTEKKIEKLFYGNVTSIRKYFYDRLGVELYEETESKEIEMLIKQRNLIVHNRGYINKEFQNLYSEFKDQEGMITFSYQKLFGINTFLSKIILRTDNLLLDKYKLDTYPLISQP